jgi:hypothetical protein
MRDKYLKSKRIDAAIIAIQRGEFIIYSYAAEYYKCDRGTLSWRIKGLIKLRKEAFLFWH